MSLDREIVESGLINRYLCELLGSLCVDAFRMHHVLVQTYPVLHGEIPSPEGQAPNKFAFNAVECLLRYRKLDLDSLFERLASDHEPRRQEIRRLFLPLSFLRALPRSCLVDRRTELARTLRPILPFATRELDELEHGRGSAFEPFVAVLVSSCRLRGLDPLQVLRALASSLMEGSSTNDAELAPLRSWLRQHIAATTSGSVEQGIVAPEPLSTLRVLAVRLAEHEDGGWTAEWVRAVERGREIIKIPLPKNTRVATCDQLWSILFHAVSYLSRARFVKSTRELVLQINVEASYALADFHLALEPKRKAKTGKWFNAVTIWPYAYGVSVPGSSHCGQLDRPAPGRSSATLAVCCERIDHECLRDKRADQKVLMCTEPVWSQSDESDSPVVDTHDDLTLSVLVSGDDVEAFFDILFGETERVPFGEIFRAAHTWIRSGRNIHLLWTDPDYNADPVQFEALTPI
ncbi:MAG: hypothetical protein MJE77_20970 [Proteobacteria bacterium]|nr:hypothetical protein [Pseudomonadota bacterium]